MITLQELHSLEDHEVIEEPVEAEESAHGDVQCLIYLIIVLLVYQLDDLLHFVYGLEQTE